MRVEDLDFRNLFLSESQCVFCFFFHVCAFGIWGVRFSSFAAENSWSKTGVQWPCPRPAADAEAAVEHGPVMVYC